MAILSTKLNKTQKMSVVEKCNEEGISVCEYIRQLIQKDLEKTREERFESSGQDVHMDDENEKLVAKNIVDQARAEPVEESRPKKSAIQMLIDLSRASNQINTEEELSAKPERKKLELEKFLDSCARHYSKPRIHPQSESS